MKMNFLISNYIYFCYPYSAIQQLRTICKKFAAYKLPKKITSGWDTAEFYFQTYNNRKSYIFARDKSRQEDLEMTILWESEKLVRRGRTKLIVFILQELDIYFDDRINHYYQHIFLSYCACGYEQKMKQIYQSGKIIKQYPINGFGNLECFIFCHNERLKFAPDYHINILFKKQFDIVKYIIEKIDPNIYVPELHYYGRVTFDTMETIINFLNQEKINYNRKIIDFHMSKLLLNKITFGNEKIIPVHFL